MNGLFLGALSHADDIRTLSTNLKDCRSQVLAVSSFANSRNLCLSTEKCEAVISPSNPKNLSHIKIDGIDIPVSQSARCLGAWWSSSPSSVKWIDSNINKARGAFFARGSGLFHGTLNPLSSRSITESCVFPVLLYGAESWILNLTLLRKLESFQCEVGRRILRLPKTVANNIVRMPLLWPSIRARTLCIKLGFLLKVVKGDDSLSSRVFRSIAADDVESLALVKQCRFLEEAYGSSYTSDVISNPDFVSNTQMKKDILDKDISLLLSESETHPSQLLVHSIASSPDCSWPQIWDHALDKGAFGTTCTLAVLRMFSLHVFSDNNCPFSGCSQTVTNSEVVAHFLSSHTTLNFTAEQCVESLKSRSESIYDYGKELNQVFRTIAWN